MKITQVAAAVIERSDASGQTEFLLGQRAPDTFYPGYWEFPGGKVEPGETPHQALVRELEEELGITVTRADPWLRREHVYEHAHVRLHFFRVREWSGELRDHVHSALAWQQPGATSVSPMLPANAPVLAALAMPDFYAITHAGEIGVEQQLAALAQALENGLKLVQIREPKLAPAARTTFARAAIELCHHCGARVLINGDAELAKECGADGVHLTSTQLATTTSRPDFALVAASCHTPEELARAAELGCDFTVFGPVRTTATHPEAEGIGWEGFAAAVAVFSTAGFAQPTGYAGAEQCSANSQLHPAPTFALGGLSYTDLDAARRAGAHGIAAIRAAWVDQSGG